MSSKMATATKEPYLLQTLPDNLRSPFRRLFYLGIVANTLGGIFPAPLGLAILAVFFALEWTGLRRRFREPSLGVLVLFTAAYLARPSVLLLVLFTLYFQAVYYWGARRNSHYLWITAVGFIHLAVVCTVMSSVLFPLVFLGYVLLLTHALMITNFLGGASDDRGRVQLREVRRCEPHVVKRMKGLGYWIGAFSVALAVVFFPILPRIQALSYQPTQFTGESVSGFTSEVTLGQIDTIQYDNRVALRVFLPRDLTRRIGRWRGAVLERWDFEGQRWTSEPIGQELEPYHGAVSLYRESVPVRPDGIRVNVSSMSDPRIFLPEINNRMPWMVTSIQSMSWAVAASRGDAGSILFDHGSWTCAAKEDLRYRSFEYQLTLLTEDTEGRSHMPRPEDVSFVVLRNCRSLSSVPDEFIQKLEVRGEELFAGYQGRTVDHFSLAQGLSDALQRSQVYTLDFAQPDSAKSLDDFLFGKKAGNCEYFATALALLLRNYGIPARLVTGFQPGRENLFSNYQMVRQSDAHSWVEAYFDEQGWMTFDPTPSGRAGGGAFSEQIGLMVDFYDFLQMQWNSHVLDYTQGQQKRFFSALFERSAFLAWPLLRGGHALLSARKTIARLLFLVFLFLLLRELAPRWTSLFQSWQFQIPGWGWPRFRKRSAYLATRVFQQIEKEWTKRGLPRPLAETPRRYLLRGAARFPAASPDSGRFADLYEASRFGTRTPDGKIEQELRSLMPALLAAAREAGRKPS
jgi:hypothetical protein